MSNKEILERAIQKAIDSGYDMGGLLSPMDPGSYKVVAPFGGEFLRIIMKSWSGEETNQSINAVIYDQAFAKALWGEKENMQGIGHKGGNTVFASIYMPKWQYHLQQLVIADDVFKYLEERAL